MSEFDRLSNLAFREGEKVVNIKFFMGDEREVAHEDMCKEAANALRQISLGASKKLESIDGHLPVTNLTEFLK